MKRTLTVFLIFLSMMTAVSFAGCKGKDKSQEDNPGISQSAFIKEINRSSMPDEAKERLKKALKAEPLTSDSKEPDLDTFCSTVFINGKNLSLPVTLNDLGDGFKVFEDEDHSTRFHEENKSVSGWLSYYGEVAGAFSVLDCDSQDKMYDLPLAALCFIDSDCDIYPVCVNGVFVGSDSDFMKERLFYMENTSDATDAEEKTYQYVYQNDKFRAECLCFRDRVNSIVLKFNYTDKQNPLEW